MVNTVTQTVILETTGIFDELHKKRYELTKEFKPKKNGKSIVVIMLNSASKRIEETDTTVNHLITRLSCSELNYSKITILNLFPDIMSKLIPNKTDNLDDNFSYIRTVLERGYDNILVGYGNSFIGNKIVDEAKKRLNTLLKDYKDKLVEISDESNSYDCSPMHPLFASMRLDKWVLNQYKIPEQHQETTNSITHSDSESQEQKSVKNRVVKNSKVALKA